MFLFCFGRFLSLGNCLFGIEKKKQQKSMKNKEENKKRIQLKNFTCFLFEEEEVEYKKRNIYRFIFCSF